MGASNPSSLQLPSSDIPADDESKKIYVEVDPVYSDGFIPLGFKAQAHKISHKSLEMEEEKDMITWIRVSSTASNITPLNFIKRILDLGLHKYQFAKSSTGCRYWCLRAIERLEKDAGYLESGSHAFAEKWTHELRQEFEDKGFDGEKWIPSEESSTGTFYFEEETITSIPTTRATVGIVSDSQRESDLYLQ